MSPVKQFTMKHTNESPHESGYRQEAMWFLKIDENQVRGPVTLATLKEWAENAVISAASRISDDGKHWIQAADLDELEMEWVAELKDGRTCGPINILAAARLVEQGQIEPDCVLRKQTAQDFSVARAIASRDAVSEAMDATGESEEARLKRRIEELEKQFMALRYDRPGQATQDRTIVGPALTPAIESGDPDAGRDFDAGDSRAIAHRTGDRRALAPTAEPTRMPPRHYPVGPNARWDIARRAPSREPVYTYDEALQLVRAEDLRELASVRRYRAQTLRWNVIASSMLIGAGVTVGSLGFILELVPLHYTGLVISLVGVLCFLLAVLLLFFRKVFSWINLSLATTESYEDEPSLDEDRPLKGVLNISFYWFNRAFRSKPSG